MHKKPGDRVPHGMRVLISGCLPPPIGGMATFYENLLASSLPRRVELSFVQTSTHRRDLAASGRLSLPNLVSAMSDCWRFLRAILTEGPQIVHIGTAFGLSFVKNTVCILVARLWGCRVLLHPHCSLAALYFDRRPAWRWYFRQMMRLVHGVVVISREWTELGSIVPGCLIYDLPNAVNLSLFRGMATSKFARPEKREPLHILYLGYLGKAKGSFDLLDAAARAKAAHDHFRFILIGDELTPGELQELKAVVAKRGLGSLVEICAPLYGDQKLQILAEADIFVYPSYHEGMPMAVMEAMTCGLAVVATRVGGLPDLVQDHVTGILVPPGRPDLILDALRKLGNDAPLRAAMGANSARLMAEQYDIEKRVDQLLDIYQRVLSHGQLPSQNAGIDLGA